MSIRSLLLALFVLLPAPLAAQGITIPNTFVNGTAADATQVNANFSSLANNALNRTAGTMTGVLKVVVGTAGAPGISNSTDATTGLLIGTAGTIGMALSGTQRFLLNGSGLTVYGVNQINSSGNVIATTLTGTIADARLSSNVPLKDTANVFTANVQTLTASAATAVAMKLIARASDNLAYIEGYANDGTTLQGYLGIGPSYTILQANGARQLLFGSSSSYIEFTTGDTSRIHASGGVSIGDTTDPGVNNLRVAGTVKAVGQPGFLASNSVSDTLQGTGATIQFDSEAYDELGNFGSNTFTAPATGRYLFTAQVYTSALSALANVKIQLNTTARNYRLGAGLVASATAASFGGSVVADMTSGDTATVTLVIDGGSTATIDGGASPVVTFFSGRLLP